MCASWSVIVLGLKKCLCLPQSSVLVGTSVVYLKKDVKQPFSWLVLPPGGRYYKYVIEATFCRLKFRGVRAFFLKFLWSAKLFCLTCWFIAVFLRFPRHNFPKWLEISIIAIWDDNAVVDGQRWEEEILESCVSFKKSDLNSNIQ